VPHFVVSWPRDLEEAPLATAGPALRRHSSFGPEGTNVNFVRFPAAGRMEIRTFERGVEAETLACGTGVLAAAAAGLAAGETHLPVTALTRGGFELRVRQVRERTWALTGDARVLAAGTLLAGAGEAQAPVRFAK
jgi:diaminopimelate epimerase